MSDHFLYDYHKSLSTLHVGCEPPHAYFIPFSTPENASDLHRAASDRFFSLCGEWDFRFYPSVREVEDLTTVAFTDSMDVPRSWQTVLGRGYDVPNYTNTEYPFPTDPPHVPEDNPCGLYHRTVTLTADMLTRDILLNFEGVDSCFYLFVNGIFAGYSQVAHMTSEFSIASLCHEGENDLRVLVLKWCDGSYLEDQDKFRLSGIFREVYLLLRDKTRIVDFYVHPDVKEDLSHASLAVDLTKNAPVTVEYTLLSPDGEILAHETTDKDRFVLSDLSVSLWSDEIPTLYTLLLHCGDEYIAQKIGFRSLVIRDRVVYTNGQKVKLRGVNRHDSHPFLGATTPMDAMVRDLMIMKQHNVNAIRTSHYPNDPRFLSLCDQYGFYVIDEADLECHGMGVVGHWNDLTNSPEWTEAYLDRARRMMERDKNHACVVMWSVGNESGIGQNHVAMINYYHERMPGCFVHSEDATRQFAGTPDNPMAKLQANLVDIDSRMYPSPDHIREHYLSDTNNPRPFYMCEYSHAMGNGPGCLKDYWDLIWNNDIFWGGCVWEFTDHSVAIGENRESDPHYTYGGDFSDFPNSGCFCVDGLVYPDRRVHTGLMEYKQIIAPFQIDNADIATGKFTLKNRRYFRDLSDLDLHYTLERNGKPIMHGRFLSPALPPQSTQTFSIPAWQEPKLPGAYTLTIRVTQNGITPWADVGYEVGFFQTAWKVSEEKAPFSTWAKQDIASAIEQSPNTFTIKVSGGYVTIDRIHGVIASIIDNGKEMLASPILPTIWRAPTDNDRNIRGAWQRAGFDRARVHCTDCKLVPCENAVKIEADLSLCADFLLPILRMKATYIITKENGIILDFDVKVREGQPPLPRFGIEWKIPDGAEHLRYYGRGPVESYIDKRHASYEGCFYSTVTNHFEHYVRPQENMAHTDTLWMNVSNADGHGLLALSCDKRFSFNCSHFSPMQLTQTAHDFELVPLKETVINLDLRQTGIGSNSCGPELFEKFRMNQTDFSFRVRLLPTRIHDIDAFAEAGRDGFKS